MMRILLLVFVFSQARGWASTQNSLRFEQALTEFMSAPEIQSVNSTLSSIELAYSARDLVLQPQLEIGTTFFQERRQVIGFLFKDRVSRINATISKPFSTGTTIRFTPTLEQAHVLRSDNRIQNTVDWQLEISQSLWRDFFGRGTRLRWWREDEQKMQDLARALTDRARLIVEFESLYWDYALALRERDLREKNVKRGQEMLRWVNDRFRRSAAESTDVLQAESLLADSRLRLSAVEQTIAQLKARSQRFLPNREWLPDGRDLGEPRDADKLITPWPAEDLGRTEKLEMIEARHRTMVSEAQAKEAREAIRPNLDLALAYAHNAVSPDVNQALDRSLGGSNQFASVGLVFRSGLDIDQERRRVAAANSTRDAAKFRQAALEADAKVAWDQVRSDLTNLATRVAQTEKLVDLQWRKANAERERYRKGRSTAFQLIRFEQDAAETEYALWSLQAQSRKTEAGARLFAR